MTEVKTITSSIPGAEAMISPQKFLPPAAPESPSDMKSGMSRDSRSTFGWVSWLAWTTMA